MGGTINRVWRVDTGEASFVLKEYRPDFPEASRVQQSIAVQMACHSASMPVPAVVPNRGGEMVTAVEGYLYVLSEYVDGRMYQPGQIPAEAARSMGNALGRLHDSLLLLPPFAPPTLPSFEAIGTELLRLLALARVRRDDPVDATAVGVLEAKLDLLSTLGEVPACESQWTHGDYEWRNVLFGASDQVVAIIDFDNAIFYPPERDVMRCIALSFPALQAETDDFFAGYAAVRRVTARDVSRYVESYRYFSTFRVWPISERYLHPERYQPHWHEMIQPFVPWDWEELTDRLANVAVRVSGR